MDILEEKKENENKKDAIETKVEEKKVNENQNNINDNEEKKEENKTNSNTNTNTIVTKIEEKKEKENEPKKDIIEIKIEEKKENKTENQNNINSMKNEVKKDNDNPDNIIETKEDEKKENDIENKEGEKEDGDKDEDDLLLGEENDELIETPGPLDGKQIVITGDTVVPKEYFRVLLSRLGARVTFSVSKKTSFLIHGELLEDGRDYFEGNKYKAAKIRRIPIYSVKKFEEYMQNLQMIKLGM